MFLPWSLLSGAPNRNRPAREKKVAAPSKTRRSRPRVEELEDRTLLATFNVDISYTGATQNGAFATPFRFIQDAIKAANANPGADSIIVYGNNTNDPSNVYVWERDGDANNDGVLDGNMLLSNGGVPANTVSMLFSATDRSGANAPLIVKMRNNIVDVGNGCQLRIVGTDAAHRVIFTSIADDAAGGDTNGDGNINAPNRADWGGIRFRAGAVDQGNNNPQLGSIVWFGDIRYTGQTLFDPVVGDQTEFASIRMEGDNLTPGLTTDQQRVQVRVWDTIFQNGGRAIDVHIWSLAGRGPDLGFNATLAGGTGAHPLTFVNNSINGCFINIPFITDPGDPRFGQVLQLDQDARLDDVGVPYVLTQRFVLANDVTVTIDPAIIIKSQRVTIDTADAADVTNSTSGKLIVNGLVERPVIFTSLTDDNILLPNTILAQYYSNGTADTNNDGNLTSPQPGDWGGIRISQGNIDHAFVKYGGGLYPLQGTFVNSPAIWIFCQDRTPLGGIIEEVRVSNTDVSRTFTGFDFGNFYDSPAISVDSYNWHSDPDGLIDRTGDIAVMDNKIHDNQGKAIDAHPMAFHDRANPYGSFGVYFARNVMQNNANNGINVRFELDLARGIDRNISRVGGYFDDADAVLVLEGQMLIVHQDQVFQIMSQRGVVPGLANGGFLDRYTDVSTFLTQGLVQALPGVSPLLLERGPGRVNPTIDDANLFYYLADFESTSRNAALANAAQNTPGTLYGEEWRDWGVDFTTSATQALKPFYIRGNIASDADPSGAPVSGNNFLSVASTDGNGSMDMTFADGASAVGFWVVDNETTSPNERIEFIGMDGNLIDSMPLPTTTSANNRVFVGRVSKQPIWRVRIIEDANDSVINGHSATFSSSFVNPITIPDNGSAATAQLTVNEIGGFLISDLNVKVNITHPRSSDLLVQLQGPDGTIITLANRATAPGATGANFTNTYFDDQAAVPINLGAAPFSGSFVPTQALSAFNGKQANGTWKLIVTDLAAGPGGAATINNFSLNFASNSANATPDAMGIDDLYFVRAPQSLVIKGANANSVITAGAVQAGYAGVTQNGAGRVTAGFVHDGNAITIANDGSATPVGFGNGGTLRILGQPDFPIIFTTINDNTVGAGTVGNVQKITGNNPGATPTPGDWVGIQIMPGANSAKAVVVTQQPNGSINTRYADANPYTIGDEFSITAVGGQVTSYRELIMRNGLDSLIPGQLDQSNPLNTVFMQDGTLIEYATVKFAQVGIDQQGYPETKLQIEGAESEINRNNPDDSNPVGANTRINPTLRWTTREDGTLVFNSVSGADRIAGRLGGLAESVFTGTDDVDWYQLPDTPRPSTLVFVDAQLGSLALDQPNASPINIFAFNYQFQLLFAAGQDLASVGPRIVVDQNGNQLSGAAGTQALLNSGGALMVQMLNGDIPYTTTNPQYDVQYVVITPAGRLPRGLVSTTAAPPGLFIDSTNLIVFYELPNSGPTGSNGFAIEVRVAQDLSLTDIPQNDSIWNPEPSLDGAFLGGYEVEFRTEGFDSRTQRPIRTVEGEYIIRNNLIISSAQTGISVSDFRETTPSNTNEGTDIPTQTTRFSQDNTNRVTNTNGVPFNNADYFLPGTQVYNNLIVNSQGDGIVLRETAPAQGAPAANLPTPTMFANVVNNTVDNAAGIGIRYTGRGGANILNNIVTNSTVGFQFTKLPDIEPLRPTIQPVVSYNLFFNDGSNITANGSLNATQNLLNVNPLFVDRLNLDYRLFVNSPAVDSAISNISDRLASARFPQEPLRAPTTDYRGSPRVDNPTRPNVGAGQFPFYDRGALEATEPPLRVIGLNVVTSNQLIGQPVTQLVFRFFGRVDMSTFNGSTVFVNSGSPTGTPVGLGAITNSYDPTTNVHTVTVQLQSTLISGTYYVTLKGTSTSSTDPGIRDISGQLLDGEFPAPYQFPSGNGIAGGTFVYFFTIRTASITGTIWNNPNGNGTIDAGEIGIPAVGVLLTWAGPDGVFGTPDDNVIPQTLTNNAGNYSFVGLQPGNYRINVNQATLPGSFFLNTPPLPRDLTLTFGQDLTGLNFGYWQDFSNATLGNLVWDDLNGDGIRQANEPALSGIIVNALWAGRDRTFGTADDQVFSTTSNAISGGNFLFNANLPAGEYQVSIDPGSIPPGYLRTTQLGVGEYPINVLVLPGSTFLGIRIGLQQRNSSIGDVVFNDLNGNGVQDAGEPGLAGVQLTLTGPAGTFFTTTDAAGGYLFGSLPAGTYTVTVNAATLPPNFYSTTRNSPLSITLPDGNTAFLTADFGYRADPLSGNVGSLVWQDNDGNGVQNGGEPGLAGVTMQLTWAGRDGVFGTADDQVFPTQTTNALGQYLFTALPIGFYHLSPIAGVPPGFALTTPAGLPLSFELGDGIVGPPNSNLGANFGYQAANASIAGLVFADLNGNSILDAVPNESGRYGGVRVFIDANNNGIFDAGEKFAVSAPGTGAWTINNLVSGVYKVMIDSLTIPAGQGLSRTPLFTNVNVAPSANVAGVNLGLFQQNASVGGKIFNDINGNGLVDLGEQPLPNVTVTLTWFGPNNINENGGGDDQTYVAITDSNGNYGFSGLPGAFAPGANFHIHVNTGDLPAGSVPTVPSSGDLDLIVPIGGNLTQNFGFRVPPSQLPGIFYLALKTPGKLFNSDGSSQTFADSDIIKLKTDPSGTFAYSLYFRGSQFGLTAGGVEGIDAMTFLNDGSILVSTVGNFSVRQNYSNGTASGATITGTGSDLLRFVPGAISLSGQITAGSWSLYFKGSRVGLSGTRGNVDAVAPLYNAAGQVTSLLLSTAGQVTLGSVAVNNFDIVRFNISALGANTAGSYSMYFKGANVGLADPTNENIDALFVNVPAIGLPTLTISTVGNFAVTGGVTGNRNDAIQFTPTALGNGTAGDWGPVRLAGNSFNMAAANIRGLFIGAAPGDPSPQMAAGYGFGQETDLDKMAIRWAADRGTVNVYIDPGSFSADEVARIHDAVQGVGASFLQVSGLRLVEVTDPAQADIRVSMKNAADLGSAATGLLGQNTFVYDTVISGFLADGGAYRTFVGHEAGGLANLNIISGWNWYAGANPNTMSKSQYDFQSVVTHELGHLLGLGANVTDSSQVMYENLRSGQARRSFGSGDLALLERLYTDRPILVNNSAQVDGSTLASLQGSAGSRPLLRRTNVSQLVQQAVQPAVNVQHSRNTTDALFAVTAAKPAKPTTLSGLSGFLSRAASIASKLAG